MMECLCVSFAFKLGYLLQTLFLWNELAYVYALNVCFFCIQCAMIGWGRIDGGDDYPDTLKRADARAITNEECR